MRVDLKTEQNSFVLRQVALLLESENNRLHARIARLVEELARMKGGDPGSIQRELESLRELLERRDQALFGDSSEKRPRTGPPPSDGRPSQKGHGPTPQLSLPVEEVIHSLDARDLVCPKWGREEPSEIAGQYETSEEVTVVERHFVIRKHLQKKYRCRCNAHIETAPGPQKLQPGARYSVDFAIEVAADKYLDHAPLERQVRIMARQGLVVTSQTLWDQTQALAGLLTPTYEAIIGKVLESPVIGADETYWRLMGRKVETENKRWWAWCIRGPNGVAFRILDSRSKKAASEILQGYSGTVMTDGYGVYAALAKKESTFVLANCWSHVRRKFWEIRENDPKPCQEILDLIGELFAVEKLVAADAPESVRLELLADLRQRLSRPLVQRIGNWAAEQNPLPKSGLGRAIDYMKRLWPGLIKFLDAPRIPLHNNGTESALRGPVVGRKNFYGARSRRGTEVAAIFYTLFETAKALHIEPKAYLRAIVRNALANPGALTLPANFTPTA